MEELTGSDLYTLPNLVQSFIFLQIWDWGQELIQSILRDWTIIHELGEPMVAMFPIVRMGSRENHFAVMERQEADVWWKNRDLIWKKDDSIWSTPSTVSEGGITFQTKTGSGLQKWMGRKQKTNPSSLTLHILHKTI